MGDALLLVMLLFEGGVDNGYGYRMPLTNLEKIDGLYRWLGSSIREFEQSKEMSNLSLGIVQ
jgi:hypothetical protein